MTLSLVLLYLIYGMLITAALMLDPLAIRLRRQGINMWVLYGMPAVAMLFISWKLSWSYFCADFNKSYYIAGRAIIENPEMLYAWSDKVGFVNIPLVAFLFTPLSYLDQRTADILFTILGLGAILLSIYLMIRLAEPVDFRKRMLVGLFLVNGPLFYSLRMGNLAHFVLLLLIGMLLCVRSKKEFFGGVFLGIAAILKLPLLLLVLYFILRRHSKLILGFASTIGLVAVISFSTIGWELHWIWLQRCVLDFIGKPMSAFNSQSLDSFLVRLLTESPDLLSWDHVPLGNDFHIIRSILASLLIGSIIWVFATVGKPRTFAEECLEIAIILCLALALSPVAWTHYYLFLLIPFGLFLGQRLSIPSQSVWSHMIMAAMVVTSLPVVLVVTESPLMRMFQEKLFVSHFFLGMMGLLVLLLVARAITGKQQPLMPREFESHSMKSAEAITGLSDAAASS